MTLVPFTDCCAMLGIDAKTLRHWLRQANLEWAAHPKDARLKCLTAEQVEHLARLHARPLQSPVCAVPALSSFQEPASRHRESETSSVQATHLLPTTFVQAADPLQRLSCLETQVSTLQQQLAQLTLELLQERTLRYEQRLHTLEVLLHPTQRQEELPPALQTMERPFQPQERDYKAPALHPAELRARSRVIPLIEYGAGGSYVLICPALGELHLTPDSPEWFDWLATLSSFRFIGQQGRFTAYRGGSRRCPKRTWSACRYIHQRNYKHYLGVTDRLTINCLEQAAATLQAHVTAL